MSTGGLQGLGVGVQGLLEAERLLLAIGNNIKNPQRAAPAVFDILNADQRRKFDNWRGKGNNPPGSDYMVETGDTRSAWTINWAYGSIRQVHGKSIEFGSSIYYNRFHWRALSRYGRLVPAQLAEVFAEHFVPDRVLVRGHTRGGRQVRPYIRGLG